MKAKKQLVINDPLVVLSDLHIRSTTERNYQLFLDVLGSLGSDVQYLVLNGDIFDFCFGASSYFRRKFSAVGNALTALAKSGVRVIYIQGNHEVALYKLGWEGVAFVRTAWHKLVLNGGATIAITHGDVLRAPWHYHIYKRIVNSTLAQGVLALFPQRLLDRWALKLAVASRGQDLYRQLDHGKILQAIDDWAQSVHCAHVVVGHFHVPYEKRFGDRWVVGVDSWEKPNLLTYDGTRFHRAYFSPTGSELRYSLVGPGKSTTD